ncbi:MAG TPA: hypothetical protein VH415_14930 [Nitrososphaeraceae archaeon]|jgi:hypothetical protein
MQRSYKILISGAALLGIGIILIVIMFSLLHQTSFSINASLDTFPPAKSLVKTIDDATAGTNMAISLNYQPPDVPFNVQVIQESGLTKLLDVNFTNKLFTKYTPTADGDNNVLITNLGSKQASGNTILGNVAFFDANGQPQVALGGAAIAGPFLSFIGVIVLIVGGVIYLLDRRKISKLKDLK